MANDHRPTEELSPGDLPAAAARPQAPTHGNSDKDIVVLIHGVGNAGPGTFVALALPVLEQFGIPGADIHEYNWHALVGLPVETKYSLQSRISRSYLAAIMYGLRGAVQTSVGQVKSRLQRLALRTLDVTADILVLAWCVAPIFWFEGALARTSDHVPAALKWVLTAAAWTNLMALIGGIVFIAGASVPAWLCRVLLIVIRPYVLLVYVPFLLPLGRGLLDLAGIIIAASLSVAIMAPLAWGDPFSLEFISAFSLFSVVVAISGILIAALLIYLLGPLLKIVSDVFRYAGDADYREKLHAGLLEVARSLGPLQDRRVLLVGHSLGSVIAVNSLLRSDSPWTGTRTVVLVTMGSPLKRLFHRFFPEWCPAPSTIANHLSSCGNIAWINVYRPFDPVGSRLGDSALGSVIQDCNTNQWWRLLLWAHTGYWNDPVVARLVDAALPRRNISFSDRREIAAVPPEPLFQSVPKPKARALGVAFLPFLAVPLGMLWLFVSLRQIAPNDIQRDRSAIQMALERDSETVSAVIIYQPKRTPRGSDHWSIKFVPAQSPEAVLWPLTEANVDMRALGRDVGFGKLHEKKVTVKYVPKDTKKFWVLDYPPKPTAFRPSLIGAILAALWFGTTCSLPLLYPSLAIWRLYLGAH